MTPEMRERMAAIGFDEEWAASMFRLYEGVWLRDYLASQALRAIQIGTVLQLSDGAVKAIAESAYRVADAMLEARKR